MYMCSDKIRDYSVYMSYKSMQLHSWHTTTKLCYKCNISIDL